VDAGAVVVQGTSGRQSIRVKAMKATPDQVKAAAGAFGSLAGPIAIAVDSATRNVAVDGVRWEAVPDYGRVKAAMTPMPVTARSFADPKTAPRLEYPVFLAKAGRYDIDLVTNPTLNINPAIQLGVAVAIDEGVPQIVRVFSPETRQSQDFLGRDYQANTEANARTVRFSQSIDAPGRHILKIMMIDPTMVIQKIIIHDAKLPDSYFGPPSPGDAV